MPRSQESDAIADLPDVEEGEELKEEDEEHPNDHLGSMYSSTIKQQQQQQQQQRAEEGGRPQSSQ
jgi:hypothetical protein